MRKTLLIILWAFSLGSNAEIALQHIMRRVPQGDVVLVGRSFNEFKKIVCGNDVEITSKNWRKHFKYYFSLCRQFVDNTQIDHSKPFVLSSGKGYSFSKFYVAPNCTAESLINKYLLAYFGQNRPAPTLIGGFSVFVNKYRCIGYKILEDGSVEIVTGTEKVLAQLGKEENLLRNNSSFKKLLGKEKVGADILLWIAPNNKWFPQRLCGDHFDYRFVNVFKKLDSHCSGALLSVAVRGKTLGVHLCACYENPSDSSTKSSYRYHEVIPNPALVIKLGHGVKEFFSDKLKKLPFLCWRECDVKDHVKKFNESLTGLFIDSYSVDQFGYLERKMVIDLSDNEFMKSFYKEALDNRKLMKGHSFSETRFINLGTDKEEFFYGLNKSHDDGHYVASFDERRMAITSSQVFHDLTALKQMEKHNKPTFLRHKYTLDEHESFFFCDFNELSKIRANSGFSFRKEYGKRFKGGLDCCLMTVDTVKGVLGINVYMTGETSAPVLNSAGYWLACLMSEDMHKLVR